VINLTEVGGSFELSAVGSRHLRFGIYLPGITFEKGYGVEVRVIHAADQLVRGIDPQPFWLFWHNASPLDLWDIDIDLSAPLPDPNSVGHFGTSGIHLYRFAVLRGWEPVGPWVADPFGTGSGLGGLSAV
jgi:hypothetical protein